MASSLLFSFWSYDPHSPFSLPCFSFPPPFSFLPFPAPPSLPHPLPFPPMSLFPHLVPSLGQEPVHPEREWVEALSKSITLALSISKNITLALSSISIVSRHWSLGSVVWDAPSSDKMSRIRSTSTLSHPRWPDESQRSLGKAHKYKLFIHFKSARAVGEVITYNLVLVYPLNHKN